MCIAKKKPPCGGRCCIAIGGKLTAAESLGSVERDMAVLHVHLNHVFWPEFAG